VSSRESRVTDQLTDGSRGSWIIKCDQLSAVNITAGCLRHRAVWLYSIRYKAQVCYLSVHVQIGLASICVYIGSALVSISEVTLHRARLVLRWASVSVRNESPRSTQPVHPFVGRRSGIPTYGLNGLWQRWAPCQCSTETWITKLIYWYRPIGHARLQLLPLFSRIIQFSGFQFLNYPLAYISSSASFHFADRDQRAIRDHSIIDFSSVTSFYTHAAKRSIHHLTEIIQLYACTFLAEYRYTWLA